MILFPGVTHDGIRAILERILSELDRLKAVNGWEVISFSIGVVTFADGILSVDEFIERADSLMYEVKKHGKNGIRYSEA